MAPDVIQRSWEQYWPGMNSRVLAYMYAVGTSPEKNRPSGPAGNVEPLQWIGSRMDRAREELGITHAGKLKDAEQTQCTELLWRYAVEERDALLLDHD